MCCQRCKKEPYKTGAFCRICRSVFNVEDLKFEKKTFKIYLILNWALLIVFPKYIHFSIKANVDHACISVSVEKIYDRYGNGLQKCVQNLVEVAIYSIIEKNVYKTMYLLYVPSTGWCNNSISQLRLWKEVSTY